jgi:hypothetical protein
MTEPCIRCGIRPADRDCDWLHCAECFQLHCDETHMAWAEMDWAHETVDEEGDTTSADLLAANDATDDECDF